MMDEKERARKLLELLASDELPTPADAETAVNSAFPEMPEKKKRLMARALTAGLPSPAEIEQRERLAQHNAEARRKREEKLAARRAKRAKLTKSRKRK